MAVLKSRDFHPNQELAEEVKTSLQRSCMNILEDIARSATDQNDCIIVLMERCR